MEKIYANLIGKWVELKENDTINNENPLLWIEEHNINDPQFITISHKNTGYRININQIQVVSN